MDLTRRQRRGTDGTGLQRTVAEGNGWDGIAADRNGMQSTGRDGTGTDPIAEVVAIKNLATLAGKAKRQLDTLRQAVDEMQRPTRYTAPLDLPDHEDP